eukprot:scaffold81287_cov72-Phaeocystis_antarctica.AAC.5
MLDADADEQALFSKVRHTYYYCYSLLTTHYSLLTTHYSLLTTHYALYSLLSQVRHLPYYTVASFMTLPWLATNAVYYLGDHQECLRRTVERMGGRFGGVLFTKARQYTRGQD